MQKNQCAKKFIALKKDCGFQEINEYVAIYANFSDKLNIWEL